MNHAKFETQRATGAFGTLLRRFGREEDGMITIFAFFMVFMMVMIGGIGADMMRHELERTRIQSVADRAVLAAADLDQPLDPEAVVRDYFAKSGMEDFVSSVNVNQGLNFRQVTVDARTVVNTQFMDWMGLDNLEVPAISSAEEKVSNVEISLVLDISGSMGLNNRMVNLQNAADTFLQTVLTPENRNLVSVSLVPYTAQVNAGADIFNQLDITAKHPWSYCVDFRPEDFGTTQVRYGYVPGNPEYEHMQHFEIGWYWNGRNWNNAIDNPTCPKRSYETIAAFSQNYTDLSTRIWQLRPRSNTAIHLGMKWGVALLDPAWQSFNAVLPSVDTNFRNRPAAFYDPEVPESSDTLKTVILMTDGENVNTTRINDNYYANLNHAAHWSRYPLNWYLDNYVYYWNHPYWMYTKYTASQADTFLLNVCDAAKEKNIVIWSIGFEVGDHGANIMRDCASSPSHFFRVEGIEITEAFSSIARQINQLKLTQ